SRQDDDIARSILMSWKLGIIDVRRVYFCDDEYEQSDEPIADDGDMEMALGTFSDGMGAAGQQLGSLPSPILVSDGEAIEDNRTYDRLTAKQRTPLAQRLGSVMNEFAAFDSDSDTNMADSPRHGRLSRPSSRPVKDRMPRAQSGSGQQESFINQFHRQQKPQQHSLSIRRPHRSAHSHPSRSESPCETENAIFIFDDDVGRPTTSRDVYNGVAFKQTKLLTNRSVAPSSSSTGTDASTVDSLAEKIGLRRQNPKNSGRQFVQAYTTLLILWHEALIMPRHAGDQTREVDISVEADVFRWIEFAQQFILATVRSKSALVQLVRGTVECVHDGIPRLEKLAATDEYNAAGATCIGLSFAVVVLQLALAVACVCNNTGSAGPRAVGEYDEIPAGWGPERFGPEVDKCLQTIVKLLSFGPQNHDPFRLGNAEQMWVALLHIFSVDSHSSSSRGKDKHPYSQGEPRVNYDNIESSLAAAGAIVQFSGIWSTVRHVCKSECSTDSQRADSLWSAFVYLLPLAQFSDEGIAAPRAALPWRPHLALMAEVAVEKQLFDCLKRSDGNKHLRASDEALVRQAFVRIHSTVVEHGLGFGPDSHVYITLYRYLESNSFSSLSIEPLPSLPRLFTRYCGSIKREGSPSDTCTILWLKALDMALGEWNAQLDVLQPSSKPHRHLLRSIRSAVSKMLPTRILTFDTSGSRAQLSTLANYYAVFLFFLHAMPSGVVRSVRLYTQF
ncbi:hypothetical protein GGI23_001723, partial [Coemansia sp. RSA 2559]